MKIVIAHKDHYEFTPASASIKVVYVEHPALFSDHEDADAFIDMQFAGHFYSPSHKPLLINETIKTIHELTSTHQMLARFCGWKGFIERPVWEIATSSIDRIWLDHLLYNIGKEYEIVPDTAGFIAPRILSCIINEAYYAIDEGISTPGEIDTAMKLGTNYPYGPVAWASMIGKDEIYQLLNQLACIFDQRYAPHSLLKS